MSSATIEIRIYLDHIASLLIPGRRVKPHEVVPANLAKVGDLKDWSDDELTLLIEESRMTLAGQETRFDRMRTTAQVVLPLSTALLIAGGTQVRAATLECIDWIRYITYAGLTGASLLVLLAGLGAGATLSVRSDFGTVFPTLISQLKPPIRRQVAAAYAGQVAVGETTLGTRVTVIRDSVTLLVLGGLVYLCTWLFSIVT
jgi:hypothetical protein